jgi:hypothetical protein
VYTYNIGTDIRFYYLQFINLNILYAYAYAYYCYGGIILDCLKSAIQEVPNLKIGEKFLIKDLFKGYEWNRLAIGERRILGSLFLNEVKNGKLIDVVNVSEKSSANQQIYIKL